MAGVGFLQSLWEKTIWEGVWPFWDPMDSACSRTASMGMERAREVRAAWRALFSSGFRRSRRRCREVRPSALSSTLASALPFSPLISSRRSALVALHLIAEEGRDGEDGGHAPGLGDEWKMGCPKVECGRVKAKFGRKTKVCILVALEKAMWATMRCTSSGCMGLVARSLFSCSIGSWQRWP